MDRNREYCIEDFIIQKKIGEGSFGSVFKAVCKDTQETVAIKKIKLSAANRSDIKNVANEMRVLCSIEHPNIVSYKCSFWDRYQSHICIVMEYLGGGDLSHKISSLKKRRQLMAETQIWTYLIQMLKGLKVLHDMKIIHRDIKSANVFITQDEKEIKLGDMNVSKVVERDFTKTRVGTPLYFSPEIWNGRSYDYKTDIWSLGCLLYEMCSLTYPFNGRSMNDLKYCASKGRYSPIPNVYSKELDEIIRMCLQVDDYKRPTVAKLLDHSYIKDKMRIVCDIVEPEAKNIDAKLIDTIFIPYDFRKMKLPSKKNNIKRSNSIGDIRMSRPSRQSSRGVSDKENNSSRNNRSSVRDSGMNILASKQNKPPKLVNKKLPPQNPSKAAIGLLAKKPPLAKEPLFSGRRLSGDYNSANPPFRVGLSPRVSNNGSRNPSPGNLFRVPSAGGFRKPLDLRANYF